MSPWIETLDDAAPLVEEVLGKNCWKDRDLGWVECPGANTHQAPFSPKDCKVFVNFDAPPQFHCFHQSCCDAVKNANRKLHAAYRAATGAKGPRKKPTDEQREAHDQRKLWTARTKAAKDRILSENAWTVKEMMNASPKPVSPAPSSNWKDVIGLFADTDIIWAGDLYDSGRPNCSTCFKTKTDWLKTSAVPGMYVCPAVFKQGAFSRSSVNLEHSPFLVVESDALTKDQSASLFQWLQRSAGLHLVAVVDAAHRSLHGWFQMPDEELLERLKLVLPVMGCDRAMFSPTQPCRLPDAYRDDTGDYQRLLYLDAVGSNGTYNLDDLVPLPQVYYDGVGKNWMIPNECGGWVNGNQSDVIRHLTLRGYDSTPSPRGLGTELDYALDHVQQRQFVDYCAALAGYKAGHYNIGGKRILVTSSPTLIPRQKGEFPLIKGIVEKMFGDQLPYFYAWLHLALEMFYLSKTSSVGQAVALAGKKNSGKSLLQGLLTKMFGGRSACPFKAMTDRTNFNSELFGAEHLAIEDAAESVDIRARKHAGAYIKKIVANETHACERKHADAITLTPRWRMTISLNDDPELLQVLPPLRGDIEDKLMLFKVAKHPMPMPTSTGAEKALFHKALGSELPAFIDFILDWRIPSNLVCDRMGVIPYHHPDLAAALKQTAPEEILVELIDEEFYSWPKSNSGDWRGRARDLYRELTGSKDVARAKEAGDLLRSPAVCGRYLKRLADDNPERVEAVTTKDHYEMWTIYPPEGKTAYQQKNPRISANGNTCAQRLAERVAKRAEKTSP